jgi:hypothetical protein
MPIRGRPTQRGSRASPRFFGQFLRFVLRHEGRSVENVN